MLLQFCGLHQDNEPCNHTVYTRDSLKHDIGKLDWPPIYHNFHCQLICLKCSLRLMKPTISFPSHSLMKPTISFPSQVFHQTGYQCLEVGKFDESSLICQTQSIPILLIIDIFTAKIYPLAKLIICQLLLIHKFTPNINDTKYSCLMVRIHTFHTIQKIWDHYIACCETTRHRISDVMHPVSYRTFCRYWLKRLSHIVIGKPRSDLCWTCQQNSMAIMKLANASDHQKQKVT